jgi:pimeloyl-ACP methyl ester carboxylesterase
MKFSHCILSLAACLTLHSCSKGPVPSGREKSNAAAGELVVNVGTYLGYDADYGTLVVPENRGDPNSNLIELPVIRVRTKSHEPRAPIFILGGGPGAPNVFTQEVLESAGISDRIVLWYLESHDVVMVGYRGVDGSITLTAPEFRARLSSVQRPISRSGMKKLGSALDRDLQNMSECGVDLTGYNVVEVAEDIEATRARLGYETIDLLSVSYGGQVAYTYCLKYPERVHRNVMVCMDAPGHLAIWDCRTLDLQLKYYAELWGRDENRDARCRDLVATVQTVLDTLRDRGRPDPDKVKIMTIFMLYSTKGAAHIFDAYIDAYSGDYEKLSLLSAAFDHGLHQAALWGDFYLKLYSMGDFDPNEDHVEAFDSPQCIMGSPLAQLFFGPAEYLSSPIQAIPKQYREGQYCNVQTLFVCGSLDFSGPARNVRRFVMPYFKNGQLVVLSEFGHADVSGTIQPEAFRHLVMTYLDKGIVDDSKYRYAPVVFEPSMSFHDWLKAQR